jgi:hypothetical protein
MTLRTQREAERILARWSRALGSSVAIAKHGLNIIESRSVNVARRLERLVDRSEPVFRRYLTTMEVFVLERRLRKLGDLIRRRSEEVCRKPPDRNCRRQ